MRENVAAMLAVSAVLGGVLVPLSTPATNAAAGIPSPAVVAATAPAPGERCNSRGRTVIVFELAMKCVKKGKRLLWRAIPFPTPTTTLTLSVDFHSNDPAARMQMKWGAPSYGGIRRWSMGPGGIQGPWQAPVGARYVFRVRDTTPGPPPSWRQVTLTCTVYDDNGTVLLTRTSTGGGVRAVNCTLTP